MAEVPIERLWEAVAPFPTRSELWLKLLERYEKLAIERRREALEDSAQASA